MNPHKKLDVVTGKPNVREFLEGEEDARGRELLDTISRAKQPPVEKHEQPLTTSHEYGWEIKPENAIPPSVVLHRPRNSTEITRFMAVYWAQKEQEKMAAMGK